MNNEIDPEVIDSEYNVYLETNKFISVEEFQLKRLMEKFPDIYEKVLPLTENDKKLRSEIKLLEKSYVDISKKVQEKYRELSSNNKKMEDYILHYCMCGNVLGISYCFNEETQCD